MLDLLSRSVGVLAYALPLTLAGTLGVVEIFVLARLRHPGRVVVPPAALGADAQTNTELNGFLRISVLNALGMGFAPALSVYTISVVGLTAGFSMMVGSIGTLTQVATAVLVGSRLVHSSPDRHLRASFGIRAVAMACPIFALPGTLTAPLFLVASAMLGAIGYAEGLLAANERLFRLIRGPAVVRQHARYLGQTSGAMTIGQVAGAAAVSLGYPAFLLLYVISSGLRVVAYREAGRVTVDQTADADHRSDQAIPPAAGPHVRPCFRPGLRPAGRPIRAPGRADSGSRRLANAQPVGGALRRRDFARHLHTTVRSDRLRAVAQFDTGRQIEHGVRGDGAYPAQSAGRWPERSTICGLCANHVQFRPNPCGAGIAAPAGPASPRSSHRRPSRAGRWGCSEHG